mmetsp:Transcript_10999/g.34938  ORF Transcript_10999/g.34938 Transcript_10999/m.34938 type:complete len:416 (+) Transcript_10999:896-2143(+)
MARVLPGHRAEPAGDQGARAHHQCGGHRGGLLPRQHARRRGGRGQLPPLPLRGCVHRLLCGGAAHLQAPRGAHDPDAHLRHRQGRALPPHPPGAGGRGPVRQVRQGEACYGRSGHRGPRGGVQLLHHGGGDAPRAARRLHPHPRGEESGHRGPLRQRQVHPDEVDDAAVPALAGGGDHRRAEHQRPRHAHDRLHPRAGAIALQPLSGGEHSHRDRGHVGRDCNGRQGGLRVPGHHGPPRGVQHPRRVQRQPLLRGAAPAHRPRAHDRPQQADCDAGRARVGAGALERGGDGAHPEPPLVRERGGAGAALHRGGGVPHSQLYPRVGPRHGHLRRHGPRVLDHRGPGGVQGEVLQHAPERKRPHGRLQRPRQHLPRASRPPLVPEQPQEAPAPGPRQAHEHPQLLRGGDALHGGRRC